MKINYRIGDLELRLNDIPENPQILHSPWSEIVQWGKYTTTEGVNAECCWTVATFEYDKDGQPELRYCGSRPLDLDEDQSKVFQSLIKEGYKFNRNKSGNIIRNFNKNYD